MTRALRDIPAVRALAEREAREFYDHAFSDHDDCGFSTLRGNVSAKWIEAFLKRLTDLSRPASRDAVARLVAEAVGLECGATAPSFGPSFDGDYWYLYTMGAHGWRFHDYANLKDQSAEMREAYVPGIGSITNPAEALALIADAVLT